jgi:hypothetical protein
MRRSGILNLVYELSRSSVYFRPSPNALFFGLWTRVVIAIEKIE